MFEKITNIAGIIANYWDASEAIRWVISVVSTGLTSSLLRLLKKISL